ncbi:luxR family Bacterial regulatory protein [Bifidobacterium sp. DSM 109960]|uniref:LuxR family Bacterial regulatory protein n=2 Tax=Bifidobacterium erythrocebi TaxID=2675325 RepID=A0A7Y0ERZ9_9BIFI|nr:luxR family Bacterial regulatory protein [Bifidobacterium sp. DSM 109960]
MHKPDVLILDMALNDASGPSVCTQIRKYTSSIGIIGVTAYDSKQYIDDLAQAGAQALVAKECLAADLKKLLPVVAKGESSDPTVFMTAAQAHDKLAQQAQNQPSLQQLSTRELQVLRRYAHDASTTEIASELGVTTNTVFTYMHRISQKLGVKNRLEAIKECKKYDLL